MGNSNRIKAGGRTAGKNSEGEAGISEKKQGQCGGPKVTAMREGNQQLSWANSLLSLPPASGLRSCDEVKDTEKEAKAEAQECGLKGLQGL